MTDKLRAAEKVVRWLWAWKEKNGGMLWGVSQFLTEKEANRLFHDCEIKKIEWSRQEFDE